MWSWLLHLYLVSSFLHLFISTFFFVLAGAVGSLIFYIATSFVFHACWCIRFRANLSFSRSTLPANDRGVEGQRGSGGPAAPPPTK